MSVTSLHVTMRDDGNPPKMWSAKIMHAFEKGHHVFTSPSIPGLFIAEKDRDKAFAQIVPLVQTIMFHTKKQKVQVLWMEEFNEPGATGASSAVSTIGILPEAAIQALKAAA